MLRWFFTPIVLALMLGFAAACRASPRTRTLTRVDPTIVASPIALQTSPPSPIAASTFTPSPFPTPNLALVRQLLLDYMAQRTPNDLARLTDPWQKLGTMDGEDILASIRNVEGADKGTLVIVSSYWSAFTRDAMLFSWRENKWQRQDLPYTTDARVVAAKQMMHDRQNEMIIAYELCGACSATDALFDLWRWDGGMWQAVWRMKLTDDRKLHGEIFFPDPALGTIVVKYSSWNRADEKSHIFDESNPGPHRWFEETWVREGDAYRLVETRVQSSAYNTLVEFVYALRHGDETAARRWVTNPALVQSAYAAKLDRSGGLAEPFDYPRVSSDPSVACSIWHIEFCNEWQLGWSSNNVMHIFIVHLVQRGQDWLIDRVDAVPPVTPTPIR
jgi:hypothetical protein